VIVNKRLYCSNPQSSSSPSASSCTLEILLRLCLAEEIRSAAFESRFAPVNLDSRVTREQMTESPPIIRTMITPVPLGTWLYHGDVNIEGMGSRMFQDQRAYERVAMHAQVICIVDSETSRGVTWNLSQAGIQVEVSNLKPKEAIQLSFRLPVSGVAVDAVGSIVWQHNRRHGIRFTHVGPQSRLSILQYVREHKKH